MGEIIGTGFKLNLSESWEVDAGETYSIFKPNGVGCIQLSEHTKDSPVVSEDLSEYAQEHLDTGAIINESVLGLFQGFSLTLSCDNQYWQYWYVSNSHTLLFITYNCALEDSNLELAEVKNLLAELTTI